MKILTKNLLLAIGTFSLLPSANADIHITPLLGFTGGGVVKSANGETFDIEPNASFAISTETDVQAGRIGLFYSHQSSDVESLNLETTIQYLMFQSSAYYPLIKQSYAYIGVGIGGSYIEADWSDNHTGFAASIFGGLEYPFSNNISFTSQIRWLGTVVDNDTTAACNLPSSNSNDCRIQFKTDWMNQFAMNAGIVITF